MTGKAIIVPPHLQGRMPTNITQALADERAAWVMAQRDAGHTLRAIAAALGLGESSLWRITSEARKGRPQVHRRVLRVKRTVAVAKSPAKADLPPAVPVRKKFQVSINSPVSGLVGHVVQATSAEAAGLRVLRVYPGGSTIAEIRLLDIEAAQ